MKKNYCDGCEAEIKKENEFKNVAVDVEGVEFTLSWPNAIPCDYDVCRYCVLDAIKALDDRPKDAK